MATTIKAPIDGYTGRDTYGPLTLEFVDGAATTDEDLTDGHKAYFKAKGYTVGNTRTETPKPAEHEPTTGQPAGNASRDAWAKYATEERGMHPETVEDFTREEIKESIKAYDDAGESKDGDH